MKRKIAMMMAMSMVFTSLPMNGFTVWAEEEYAMDEIVEEEVSDELDTGLEQSILAASENAGGIENQPEMWDGEILIESISEQYGIYFALFFEHDIFVPIRDRKNSSRRRS